MRTTTLGLVLLVLAHSTLASAQAIPAKRPIRPSDLYRLQTISDPQVAPGGAWVAYVLTTVDSVKDKRNTDIWMVGRDGSQPVQLTNAPEGESRPRFSPDGKYLSFVAKRGDDKDSQIYLLDRRGGDAARATTVKGNLADYVWSPDGARLLLAIQSPDYADSAKSKVRTPYVIDRFHFKQDGAGYLDRRPTHLYLFDVAAKTLDTLTTDPYDETQPAFSPDGQQITFVSNRTADPDRNENTDLYVMEARRGAPLTQLTTWPGADEAPVWSPDGQHIAYLQSSSDANFTMYGEPYLAVISRNGGAPALLSKPADRPVRAPRWSADGHRILAILQDDRERRLVEFDASSGELTRRIDGEGSVTELEHDPASETWVVAMSTPQRPAELFLFESGAPRALTHVHDAFLAPLELAAVEGFQSKSKDGTLVSGLLYRPPHAPAGQRLPLVLYIHGGPVAQDDFGFDVTRQVLAGAGFAVAAVNYRGSSGRGVAFTRAIYADWGNKEVMDILGAADYLVRLGIADEQRLGIAGWSYGGISTNYTIATDHRFKAAVSGAASSLQLTMYGTDQYVTQYESELGPPWKQTGLWLKLSYPFLHAERITTPTLFMASQNDFNVPVAGAEQMYQALRSTGVATGLIIYPNQNHGVVVPSYVKDRLERHIAWFKAYLK
jgi:dipeptidyl aminopeptidase/acylaminoacyl peptidase